MYRFLTIILAVWGVVRVSEAGVITVPEFISELRFIGDWDIFEDFDFPGPPSRDGWWDGEQVWLSRYADPMFYDVEDEWGTFTCYEEDLEYVYRDDLSSETEIDYLYYQQYFWWWSDDSWSWSGYESAHTWLVATEWYHVWQAVPEPGTLCVLALGAPILVIRQRRR